MSTVSSKKQVDPIFIMGHPCILRFQWETEVCLTNIYSLKPGARVHVLLLQDREEVLIYLKMKFPQAEFFVYPPEEGLMSHSYQPANKPFLMYKHLQAHPEYENETFFQIDSDVIFREIPDFSKMAMDKKILWGSDCGGYLDYGYLSTRRNGPEIVDNIAAIMSIDRSVIEDTLGAGAHYLYANPTAAMFWHIWQDSQILWTYINSVDSDIQRWTMEMTAQLYNFAKFGWTIKLSDELKFCMPTDHIDRWEQTKILHNAGAMGIEAQGLFFKGKYDTFPPFGEDLSWVRRDRCSYQYVKAIEAAR